MNEQATIAAPFTKMATVWAAIGITSWTEAASFVAFIYSAILLLEWTWKKIVRPLMICNGFIKDDTSAPKE